MKTSSILLKLVCAAAILLQSCLFVSAQNPDAAASANAESVEAVQGVSAPDSANEVSARVKALEQKSIKDAKNLHKKTRDLVFFIRENISPTLADLVADKFMGVRIIFFILAAAVMSAAWLFQRFVLGYIFKLLLGRQENSQSTSVRARIGKLKKPVAWAIMLFAVMASLYMILPSEDLIILVGKSGRIVFLFIVFWILLIVSDIFFGVVAEKSASKFDSVRNLIDFGNKITRYFLYAICLLVILDTCGANINAIIASLGIGGAALAFASKDTIANFFGSVSLIVDRPFVVGDWITACGAEGIVESIGFRSTRIRTFPRTIVTIPNSVLANESVENFSKCNKRRVKATIGLTYSTTPEQMVEIVEEIKRIVVKEPLTDSEDMRIWFSDFSDSSLAITVIYYVTALDGPTYSEVMQRVNIEIMKAVAARKLSFAFPSQSIYVESLPKQS